MGKTRPHAGSTSVELIDSRKFDLGGLQERPPKTGARRDLYFPRRRLRRDLVFRIQGATQEFHEIWRGRLGLPSRLGIRKEPWQRIKALSRRLGEMGVDEYFDLKPVADLRDHSGFAILALNSLLVETLQQFCEGVAETPYVIRNGRRILASEEYFTAFLTSQYFGPGFDDHTAILFYRTVRCGILHQAEVKGSSLVRRDRPLVSLSADRNGVVVNPLLFHYRVESALRRYLADLRKRTEGDLRRRFRDKMNHIARVGAGV